MYQPLIKFPPYPAIITQVLRIFAEKRGDFRLSSYTECLREHCHCERRNGADHKKQK